jgi:hypothetical protein
MAGVKLTKKQRRTLKELERLARKNGLHVSYGDLRFGGLKLKPGICEFKGEPWVVMDRRLPFEDQAELFCQALADVKLRWEDVPPELSGMLSLHLEKNGK